MYMPSIFHDNFMDDVFDSVFSVPFEYKKAVNQMSTDITDCGDFYQLEIELPGYAKEEVKAELKDGYLTIEAAKEETKENKEEQFIRRERFTGKCSRSYYVGDQVTKEDIQAKFDNGVLALRIPKKEAIEKKEDHYILIE
ncbi:Hsp20/alpha crystallin family protein [[Clostridium] polysaccharolyticum]|jgi:HSP20 family molecular chaperone IbpA|uniref:Molecular chaperone IbpA, HSP20 family n=1 Tax=[Clostridium] polysaccharolyticum TaxID=29364 RepID=A0A1I0ADJ6_9FIRM|nr:Hsp20/alpha crystallin family protein [[Clostridium] polysaccharolyticum]SES92326.1 Molecular chaperone IbpA, HSP20 family [[Clostridium] polysaccharolyticum]